MLKIVEILKHHYLYSNC